MGLMKPSMALSICPHRSGDFFCSAFSRVSQATSSSRAFFFAADMSWALNAFRVSAASVRYGVMLSPALTTGFDWSTACFGSRAEDAIVTHSVNVPNNAILIHVFIVLPMCDLNGTYHDIT